VTLDPDEIEFGEGLDMSTLPSLLASEAEIREAMASGEAEAAPAVCIVTAEDFAAVDEPGAAALLGSEDNAVITEDSDVMLFGDGGSGKTTMGLDISCHFAAGDDWIAITVAKSARVLLIENEGPRPRFRRKVKRKLEAWSGSELDGRLHVLEDPWGGFSYADPTWRQTLADVVRELEIDVVIVGPLTASGMEAAGTLLRRRCWSAATSTRRGGCSLCAARRPADRGARFHSQGGRSTP
jgi:hypothetical protein